MAITYRDVIPPLIENTDMQVLVLDGADYAYTIRPSEGYLLHDNRLDQHKAVEDENGNLTEGEMTHFGFYRGMRSVPMSYDLTANPYGFYAVLASEIPEFEYKQILKEQEEQTLNEI